ncbi:MAG: S41 family peptidase, partial [Planctomycetota bacterium]
MRTALALLLLLAPAAPADSKKLCARDVKFALRELEKRCGHFFKLKGIRWPGVRREISRQLKSVATRQDHYALLCRLVARLRDGHASVQVGEGAKGVQWPGPVLERGPGMFLCRSGEKILVKSGFAKAAASGVEPGMELVAVEGVPAAKWLDQRTTELRELRGFSTDQQGFFFTCHWGLGGPAGSRLALQLRTLDHKSKKITLSRTASVVPVGPAFFPEGLEKIGRQSYGRTKEGYGYIHLRDVPRDLPQQLDRMLAALQEPPGLILDCRSNGGGACDHDAVYGRFLPPGKSITVPKKTYVSQGPNPYGGPMVVLVDAGVRSAGETIAGIFKEDGRAYMLGE